MLTSAQLILATDGAATFAVFIHEGSEYLPRENFEVGFDAGNQTDYSVRNYNASIGVPSLTESYRIDGQLN